MTLRHFFFIFLQDICKFEEVGGAGFLELIQHTMDLQHKSSTPLRAKDIMPHPIYIYIYMCVFNLIKQVCFTVYLFFVFVIRL